MSKDALLAELDRLLDAGEPLLTLFPKLRSGSCLLLLSGNLSPEMRLYAQTVALRTVTDGEECTDGGEGDYRRLFSSDYLTELVEAHTAGLLGWRAIGVL